MPVWKGAHPRNFRSGRRGYRPEAIVIHVMDGTLVGTDAWFSTAASGVSAHYGIGNWGEVHQYVKEADSAFHAGTVVNPTWAELKREGGKVVNPNLYTIGIEHEGRGLSTAGWPAAMRAASVALVADIARRWDIPIDARHIIRHRAIRSSKPNCPGQGVDLAAYITEVAAHQASQPAPQERPFSGTIRVIRTANVRRRPDTRGNAHRRMLTGDTFTAEALVVGEAVSGNANWFRNAAGEFLWAGTTDQPLPS